MSKKFEPKKKKAAKAPPMSDGMPEQVPAFLRGIKPSKPFAKKPEPKAAKKPSFFGKKKK